MVNQSVDPPTSSLNGAVLGRPQELPHGLIAPPGPVLAIVAAEKAKFPPTIFTSEAQERLTNDLTLQFYFERAGCEVLYRSTRDGPEVVAAGFDEIAAHKQRIAGDPDTRLSTWLP